MTKPNNLPTVTVETVLGPVPADDLGFVLPHEHLAARLWDIKEAPGVARGGTLGAVYVDDDLLAAELSAFKQLGGGAIVELTLPAIGRDPLRYRRLIGKDRRARGDGLRMVPGALLSRRRPD